MSMSEFAPPRTTRGGTTRISAERFSRELATFWFFAALGVLIFFIVWQNSP